MANAFYVIGKFGASRAIYDAPTGYVNLNLGTVKIGSDQVSITGAAWDPVGGKLYGVTRTVDPIYPKSLVEINPPDPTSSTLIGALGTTNSCTDITCSPSGQLFGYTAGNNGRLVSINKTTGVASNVGGLGPDFSGGIAFVGSTCYYIPASLGSAIYTVNTSTGVFTDTGIVHTTAPFAVEALEYHDGVMYGGGANNYYTDINLATGVGEGISFVTVLGISDIQALVSVPIPPAPSQPIAPANDAFNNAQQITGLSGVVGGTLVNATPDWPPSESGNPDGNVWYKWTAPRDGLIRLDSPFAYGFLWEGSTLSGSTLVGNFGTEISVNGGTEYHISVAYSSPEPFNLAWSAFDTKPINTEVSIAFFDSALSSSPSYYQIDNPNPGDFFSSSPDIVGGFRIDRGRASEFDKTGTGTATIDIFDEQGTVDPTNSSSLFAGNINPMKPMRIRLRNPVDDTWHYLFTGFTSEWVYDVDISGAFTKVTLDCADAFDLLSSLEMTPGNHGDTPPVNSLGDIYFLQGPPGTIGGVGPSRIHKALDDAGWPAAKREVLPGNVLLQETVYARRDQLLSVIFDAADAEFPGVANVYINKVGDVTFHGRYTRFDPTNPDYGIQFWKVGTGPIAAQDSSIAPISALRFRRSKSDIINAAMSVPQLRVGEWTVAELGTMIDMDTDSIAEYGWRSDSFDNLLTYKGRTSPETTSFPINAVDETRLFSNWRIKNYANPTTRIEQIVIRPQQPSHFSASAIWGLMCGVEIGDIITVHTDHPGGGGFNNVDFFVEGLHYDVQPGPEAWPDVTLTIDLSPRSLYEFNPFGMTGGFASQATTQPPAVGPLSRVGVTSKK